MCVCVCVCVYIYLTSNKVVLDKYIHFIIVYILNTMGMTNLMITVELIYINSASVFGGRFWPYIDGHSIVHTISAVL